MSWIPQLRFGGGAQNGHKNVNNQTSYTKNGNKPPQNLPPPGTPGHGKPPDKKGINA